MQNMPLLFCRRCRDASDFRETGGQRSPLSRLQMPRHSVPAVSLRPVRQKAAAIPEDSGRVFLYQKTA